MKISAVIAGFLAVLAPGVLAKDYDHCSCVKNGMTDRGTTLTACSKFAPLINKPTVVGPTNLAGVDGYWCTYQPNIKGPSIGGSAFFRECTAAGGSDSCCTNGNSDPSAGCPG